MSSDKKHEEEQKGLVEDDGDADGYDAKFVVGSREERKVGDKIERERERERETVEKAWYGR